MPVEAPALTTVDILATAAANLTENWMDPDAGPNATDVAGWPMLPIHPKFAILFLQGPPSPQQWESRCPGA
jgi:hypothetical protein